MRPFISEAITIVADPKKQSGGAFARFAVTLVDKNGVLRARLPGSLKARPRLDVLIRELARIAGKPAPAIAAEGGKVTVSAARRGVAVLKKDEDAITPRWMWSHDCARPGDELKLAFCPTIARGFHVYSPWEKALTPFSLSLELPEGLSLVSEVAYPKATSKLDPVLKKPLSVYAKDIPMATLRLKVGASVKPGQTLVVKARLRFQACDDKRCLAPTTRIVELPIKIAPRETRRGQVFGWQRW